jgi:hypothetical protein
MESGEVVKELLWAVAGATRAYRAWAAIAIGVIAYFVIPFLPTKPSEPTAAVQPTIQQKSGDNNTCSNIAATGNGKVNCSSTQEENPGAKHPATP